VEKFSEAKKYDNDIGILGYVSIAGGVIIILA
jgi:hypothetical protein